LAGMTVVALLEGRLCFPSGNPDRERDT